MTVKYAFGVLANITYVNFTRARILWQYIDKAYCVLHNFDILSVNKMDVITKKQIDTVPGKRYWNPISVRSRCVTSLSTTNRTWNVTPARLTVMRGETRWNVATAYMYGTETDHLFHVCVTDRNTARPSVQYPRSPRLIIHIVNFFLFLFVVTFVHINKRNAYIGIFQPLRVRFTPRRRTNLSVAFKCYTLY